MFLNRRPPFFVSLSAISCFLLGMLLFLAFVPPTTSNYAGLIDLKEQDIRKVNFLSNSVLSTKTIKEFSSFLNHPKNNELQELFHKAEKIALEPDVSLDEVLASKPGKKLQKMIKNPHVEDQNLILNFVLATADQDSVEQIEGEDLTVATPVVAAFVVASLRAVDLTVKFRRAFLAMKKAQKAAALAKRAYDAAVAAQRAAEAAQLLQHLGKTKVAYQTARQNMYDELRKVTMEMTMTIGAAALYARQWIAEAERQCEEDKNPLCQEAMELEAGIIGVSAKYYGQLTMNELDALRLAIELN